jgi:hypothetical protein
MHHFLVFENKLSTPTLEEIEKLIIQIQKQELNIDEADKEAQKIGLVEKSPRFSRIEVLRQITQDFITERKIRDLGINPDNLNPATVPQPAWEIQIRNRYWNQTKESII